LGRVRTGLHGKTLASSFWTDLAVLAKSSLGRAGTGLYRKSSSFRTVALAGAWLFRRQKNQSETMKAMSAIPPTVPPTMAPKLGVVEGAVAEVVEGGEVLVPVGVPVPVGVLVNWDEPEVGGVGVPEITLVEIVGSGIEELLELLLDTVEDVLVLATEALEEVAL
jgi:hypothetical protein